MREKQSFGLLFLCPDFLYNKIYFTIIYLKEGLVNFVTNIIVFSTYAEMGEYI